MWVHDIRALSLSRDAVVRSSGPPDAVPLAMHAALELHGAPMSREAFLAAWRHEEMRRTAARWTDLSDEPIESVLQRIAAVPVDVRRDVARAAAEALATSLEWHADALPTLDYLRESGYRVALLSDSLLPLGASWDQRVAPWIDVVVSSPEIGRAAPHPAPFQALAGRLHVPPGQLLHVGGSLAEDVFGAKGAGLRAALLERVLRGPPDPQATEWLLQTHGHRLEEVQPDLKVRTLEEIPAILDEFG